MAIMTIFSLRLHYFVNVDCASACPLTILGCGAVSLCLGSNQPIISNHHDRHFHHKQTSPIFIILSHYYTTIVNHGPWLLTTYHFRDQSRFASVSGMLPTRSTTCQCLCPCGTSLAVGSASCECYHHVWWVSI